MFIKNKINSAKALLYLKRIFEVILVSITIIVISLVLAYFYMYLAVGYLLDIIWFINENITWEGAGLIIAGFYFLFTIAFEVFIFKETKYLYTALFIGILNLFISLFLLLSVVAIQGA